MVVHEVSGMVFQLLKQPVGMSGDRLYSAIEGPYDTIDRYAHHERTAASDCDHYNTSWQ